MPSPAPAPLRPFSEHQLLEMWRGRTAPVATLICPTFNHAAFVSSALDGLLGQVTDFPFEVIVRDDASTDGTAEVIRQYAARYPTVIRAILEDRNTFSRGVSFLPPLLRAARGEFVAGCAGDDYWFEPTKLATQVSTLRKHPDAAMCFHDIVTVRDGLVSRSLELPAGLPSTISTSALCLPTRWFPMPVTWVYRLAACDFEASEFDSIMNEDNLLLSQFARFGPAVYLPERWAAYRLHGSSMYSARSERHQRLARINSFLWISRYHFRTGQAGFGRRFARAAAELAEVELDTFGPPVARWSVLMLLRAFLLPERRLRRVRQIPHGLYRRIKGLLGVAR